MDSLKELELKEKTYFKGIESGRYDRREGILHQGKSRKEVYIYDKIFLKGYNIGYNFMGHI